MKRIIHANLYLFLVSLGVGYLLRHNPGYLSALHELNHLVAALLSGNVPIGMSLDLRLSYYLPITAHFIPSVRDFVSISGSGLAYAAPAIVYIVGLKMKVPGLAGFWIPGAAGVLNTWGRGPDFAGVDPLPWVIFMGLFTLGTYLFALSITVENWERSREENRTKGANEIRFPQRLENPGLNGKVGA